LSVLAVVKLFVVQPYSLDKYKSKEDKLQLLDDAVSSHDGNAIIIVSRFTVRLNTISTLHWSILQHA